MTMLSELALQQIQPVVSKIKQHPFNQELANGSLDLAKFGYYIEQDKLYLADFSRSLAIIASKVPAKFMKDFLLFSNDALITEQEIVHNFFQNNFDLPETGKITPATISYTSYLLKTSTIDQVEIAIAAVLPCFWVYKIIGDYILQITDIKSKNPYEKWIKTYSGPEFTESLEKIIRLIQSNFFLYPKNHIPDRI